MYKKLKLIYALTDEAENDGQGVIDDGLQSVLVFVRFGSLVRFLWGAEILDNFKIPVFHLVTLYG